MGSNKEKVEMRERWTNAKKEPIDLFKLVRENGSFKTELVGAFPRGNAELEMKSNGLYRQAFHTWLIAPWNNGSMVLQYRAPGDWRYPQTLDISASGIPSAGMNIVTGGLLEIRSETLVPATKEMLIKSGIGVESGVFIEPETGLNPGKVTNVNLNELVHIFFMKLDKAPKSDENPDIMKDEVKDLYSVSLEHGADLFRRAGGRIRGPVNRLEFDRNSGTWVPTDQKLEDVSLANFVPRNVLHYLRVFERAQEVYNA